MASFYPERPICPKPCKGIGAFKKAEHKTEVIEFKDEKPQKPAEEKPVEEPVYKELPQKSGEEYLPQLRPGPDGKVNWTPLAEMTGTRPTVNKYALSRYSLEEWTAHNNEVLDLTSVVESNIIDYDSKTAMMSAFGNIDKQQRDNDMRLKQKAKELFRWKAQVEAACKAMSDEVELMEVERQRLKGASRVLMLPEAISKECLDLRSNRSVPDLVSDFAEQQLIKEMNLVSDIRTTLKNTLAQIEAQQATNKAVKHKIEYDWCDKQLAYNIDCENIKLNTKSPTIMFRPGATRYGDPSAPLEYWEFFCRETIMNCESARQKSVDLRSTLNSILVEGGRKLRMQADKTDVAISETVAIQNELCTKLEQNLLTTIQKLADMESLVDELKDSIRKMDAAMKLAQTRLENRNIYRNKGENVRDQAHVGLINEVQKIHSTVSALRAQMFRAEKVRKDLLAKRIELEKDIASKRKSLNIDRNRCGVIRSHYPSASELAGF